MDSKNKIKAYAGRYRVLIVNPANAVRSELCTADYLENAREKAEQVGGMVQDSETGLFYSETMSTWVRYPETELIASGTTPAQSPALGGIGTAKMVLDMFHPAKVSF